MSDKIFLILKKSQLDNALNNAIYKINRAIPMYSNCFPDSSSIHGVYGKQENNEGWTQSFWTGILWLAYEFTRKALAHVNTTLDTVVREDGSTFQNFYFDQKTGERLGGGTKQGLSDSSAWSRGQAWGVTGPALAYSHCKDDSIMKKYW